MGLSQSRDDDVFQFAAISPCIHEQTAADRSGNTRCKLHTGQSRMKRFSGRFRHEGARAGIDPVTVGPDLRKMLSEADNHTVITPVRCQHIRAAPQQEVRDVPFFQITKEFRQCLLGRRA